jgi:hypothetical protein
MTCLTVLIAAETDWHRMWGCKAVTMWTAAALA